MRTLGSSFLELKSCKPLKSILLLAVKMCILYSDEVPVLFWLYPMLPMPTTSEGMST